MSRRLLAALGLDRPEARAWATYDWAISGMQTTIMSAVFPIYFVRVAAAEVPGAGATQLLARWNAIALAVSALVSPLLGAIADARGAKKPLLGLFTLLGAASTAALFGVERGDALLAGALFAACMVAGSAATTFYEALLPHVAPPGQMDRVSTAGFAVGYVGGGVLLAVNLLWIQRPEWFGLPHGPGISGPARTLPVRLAFVSVAVWWIAFAVPLFRRVREPPRRLEAGERERAGAVRLAVARLVATLRELRRHREAAIMLVAFLVYNDGIQTIIKMAAAYGAEIGIGSGALLAAILMVQFVGIPCSFLFGALAGRIGAKRAVLVGLAVYTVIALLGWRMRSAAEFFVLAGLVGVVQGGTQALSRSLFASMIPPHRSGELFGYWGVFEKFSGVLGPLAFDLVIAATGSSRSAVLAVIGFFAIGAALLAVVDVEAGRRAAIVEEASAHDAAARASGPA